MDEENLAPQQLAPAIPVNSPRPITAPVLSDRQYLRDLGIAALIYLAVFGLEANYIPPIFRLLAAPAARYPALATYVFMGSSTFLISLMVGTAVFLIYRATRAPLDTAHSALLVCSCGLLWAALTFYPPGRGIVRSSLYSGFTTLLLALASAFAGRVIATAFKDRNLVAVGAGVGALVDIWGVFFGSTKQIVEQHAALHQQVSVHLPQIQASAGGPRLSLLIGPGDYIFIGIMLALVHRFGMKAASTAIWIWLLTVLSLLLVIFVPGLRLPGIVGMAIAVILPNLREFKFTRQEVVALLCGLGLLVFLAVVWAGLHSHHPSGAS